MAAFAESFKSEVARIARKQGKGDFESLRKMVSSQRSDIVALKKQVKLLTTQVNALVKASGKAAVLKQSDEAAEPARRGGRKFVFRPEALIAKRASLHVTGKEMCQLLGAAPATLARWETGKAKPRAAQLERIRAVLALGTREARAKLAAAPEAG
jgi:DNA-binding transcriptional regulator YiaG